MKNIYYLIICAILLVSKSAYAQNVVTPSGAASSRPSHSGEEVTKCLDGNLTTLYHSDYGKNAIPDTVDFVFTNAKSINQIVYYPRQTGTNGMWSNVEVYHSTLDDPSNFVKDYTLTWPINTTAKTINFDGIGIVRPYIIRFVVKAGVGNYSSCAEMKFFSSETGAASGPSIDCTNPTSDLTLTGGTKITVASASVSPVAQSGQGIDKTIDNNLTSIYHSLYSPTLIPVNPSNPVSLTYNFTGDNQMDFIDYTPRSGGGNGAFGKGEIYYTTDLITTPTKLMDFDALFSSDVTRFSFPQTLVNVRTIIVKVLTGRNEFASCAEMTFYKNSGGATDLYTNIFEDDLHTKIRAGITQADIDAITSPYFKSLANCIFNNTYKTKYRVQTYEYYPNPSTVETLQKTNGLSRYENPTGIAFDANSQVVIFVGETNTVIPSLMIKDFALNDAATKDIYPLKRGMNVFNITNKGLGYIQYYTDNAASQPIKINITTGKVNGYYNPQTDTDAEWVSMLTNGFYPKLDIKGKYVSLNYDKDALLGNSSISGKALIDAYDSIVHKEYILMGLTKYNKEPKNHMFARSAYNGGFYAGGEGAHFDLSWGARGLANVDGVFNGPWGIAHEFGHNNQVRPGAKWIGMTEVTNNFYSAWVQYTYGTQNPGVTRLEKDNGGDNYSAVFDNNLIQKKHIQTLVNKPFLLLIPLWQLELYYQAAGAAKHLPTLEERLTGTPAPVGNVDVAYWYADLLEKMRTTSQTGMSNGQLALNFIVKTCDVVQEDLSDFFVKSGYLAPIDIDIDDYGTQHMTITQADVDATIAAIKAKGYPQPVSPVINYMSANSVNAYKNLLPVSGTVGQGVTLSGTTLTITNNKWPNAVAFETYKQNDLSSVVIVGNGDSSTVTTFTKAIYPEGATSVYAVGYDGTRKLVYPNTSPTVSVTSPATNAKNNAPASVTITADAADVDGTVAKVEFYQGNIKLGESSTAPYSFTWDNVAAGAYVLTAKATDNSGAVTTSTAVNITVNALPVISITSPVDNASYNALANITINVDATDTDGSVSKVEFFQGATKLGEVLTAPYSFDWNGVVAGTYTITAKATDNDGVSTTSTVVNLSVVCPPVQVTIPDVYAMNSSTDEKNTIYLGYGTPSLTMTASVTGGQDYTYNWSTGEQTPSISVSQAGTYTVTVSYAGGCQSSASVMINVLDVRCGNDDSKVQICHNDKVICIEQSSVQDHLNHGDKLGSCSTSSKIAIGKEEVSSPSFMVYPNPVQGSFNVSISNLEANATIGLYTILGNKIREVPFTSVPQNVYAGDLPAGTYIVIVQNGVETLRSSIVK